MMRKFTAICITLFLTIMTVPCFPMVIIYTFDEIVQKADVIFIGTVKDQQCRYGPNGKMILTDVYFEVAKVIYQSQESEPFSGNEIVLTFAGGQIGERKVGVSDVPSLETGRKYLIFTKMDGKNYASPIIGASQGLFPVITDEVTGVSHPLTYGKRPIVEIKNRELAVGRPVTRIRSGIPEETPDQIELPDFFFREAPRPVQGMEGARATVYTPDALPRGRIMNLDEFIVEILKRLR